jgi:hypothetical protein
MARLRGVGRAAVRAAPFLIALVLLLPTGLVAGSRGEPIQSIATDLTPSNAGITASATWNGQNISNAGSTGSAFALGSSSIDVRFYWSTPVGSAPAQVTTARLVMFFLGFGVATRDVTLSGTTNTSSGVIDLYWNGTGLLADLIEGTYQVTASLLDAGQNTLWSENFYVKMTAPFDLLAASPIILLVIGIWEAFLLATSGKQDLLKQNQKPQGAPKGKPAPPPDASAEPTEADASSPPPPSGGSP